MNIFPSVFLIIFSKQFHHFIGAENKPHAPVLCLYAKILLDADNDNLVRAIAVWTIGDRKRLRLEHMHKHFRCYMQV